MLENNYILLSIQGKLEKIRKIKMSDSSNIVEELAPTIPFSRGILTTFPNFFFHEEINGNILSSTNAKYKIVSYIFMIEQSGLFSETSHQDFMLTFLLQATSGKHSLDAFQEYIEEWLTPRTERGRKLGDLIGRSNAHIIAMLRKSYSVSYATRTYQLPPTISIREPASLFAVSYYIYGGMMLSRHENLLTDEVISPTNSLTRIKSIQKAEFLTKFLIDVERLFLSRSPSTSRSMRDFFEQIIENGRYRERWQDQQGSISRLQDLQALKSRRESLKSQSAIQTLLATVSFVGLPLGLFFGLFSISSNAEIITSAGSVLFTLNMMRLIVGVVVFTVSIFLIIYLSAFYLVKK